MKWLNTISAKKSIEERKYFAEWVIAEAKTLHCLSETKSRGLEKVTIQVLMIATVQNLKPLLKLHNKNPTRYQELINRLYDYTLNSKILIYQ